MYLLYFGLGGRGPKAHVTLSYFWMVVVLFRLALLAFDHYFDLLRESDG